jgi:HTH-type transcriptional regulator/antitoxin HigA
MREKKTREGFAPGEFIQEELEERKWNQEDLAAILGRSPKVVSEIISGRTAITPKTADGLGSAFGTSAQLWMNLEAAYRLSLMDQSDPAIARRAAIYAKAPIREMVKRNWIEGSDDAQVLERRLLDFLEIRDLSEEPKLAMAARKSTSYDTLTPAQEAWLFRAKHIAPAAPGGTFSKASLEHGLQDLRSLMSHAEDVRRVPRLLAEMGIRLLIVEPLPQTRIDGACFWLDNRSPVVVLSMRFDRIDCFWFTLMHEVLGHVQHPGARADDNVSLDLDLNREQPRASDARPQSEKEADRFAEDFLVSKAKLDDFVARVSPFYSKMRIEAFAARMKVHPGIVVGLLQYRGEVPYTHNREMLVRVRSSVTPSALTDGWGCRLPADL